MSIEGFKGHAMTPAFRAVNYRPPQLVRWSFYLFLFSLCFENYSALSISASFTVAKLTGFLFAAAFVANWWNMRTSIPASFWVLIFIWLELATVTLFVEYCDPVDRSAFRGILFSLAQCIILYWLAGSVMRDNRTAVHGLLAFAAGATLMSCLMALGIGRTEIRETADLNRVSFFGANANMVALWAALGILIIVGLVIGNVQRWSTRRYVLLAAVPPALLAILATGSRGGPISLALGLSCFLLVAGSMRSRILFGLAALMIGGGLFYYSQGGVLGERMSRTFASGDTSERDELWSAAIQMIKQKPLTGWGTWNADDSVGEDSLLLGRGELQGRDAHNAFLAFWVFGGALAGLPFMFLSIQWLCRSYELRFTPWGALPLALTIFTLSTLFKGGGSYVVKIIWLLLAFAASANWSYQMPRGTQLSQASRKK